MKKFQASRIFSVRITEVEIFRETDSYVFVVTNGAPRKERKFTEHVGYFDTWEEAKNFLVEKAEVELAGARRTLQRAQDQLGNVKGLKKPGDGK